MSIMEQYDRPPSELLLPNLRPATQAYDQMEPQPTYYDRPMIKPPTWQWYIPVISGWAVSRAARRPSARWRAIWAGMVGARRRVMRATSRWGWGWPAPHC